MVCTLVLEHVVAVCMNLILHLYPSIHHNRISTGLQQPKFASLLHGKDPRSIQESNWTFLKSVFSGLCFLASSSLVSLSALFCLHSSPGGDYEWHDTNVSTSCSVACRQEEEKKRAVSGSVSSSLISSSLSLSPRSPPLSQQVGQGRGPCPVTLQLCAGLTPAPIAASWIRLGSYRLGWLTVLELCRAMKGSLHGYVVKAGWI